MIKLRLAFLGALYIYSFCLPNLYASSFIQNDSIDDQEDFSMEDSIVNSFYPPLQVVEIPVTNYRDFAPTPRFRSSDDPIDNPYVPGISTIDYTKAVGEIEVTSGVSPTGAKTYDVPIKICPARHDFAPHLTLSYNSQRGNSSVGVGWTVSGLTEITRIGKTIYYDGVTEGIRMNNTDAFAINGTRLIKKSETGDYILYQSETGNIMVKGYTSGDVMSYFEVFYPDGTHGVCGYTTNDSNHLTYPQMSLTDLWDNEIQFFYTFYDGHYVIFKIMYTGGTIDFVYQSKRPDPILMYKGGTEILEDKLLSQIICKRGTSVLGTYSLSYQVYRGQSHLTEIGYTADGVSLNPLCFYYNIYDDNGYYESGYTQLPKYHVMPSLGSVIAVVGRFDYLGNKDGLIVYPTRPAFYDKKVSGKHIYRNHYTGSERIFLYTGIGEPYAHVDSLITEDGFVEMLCADLYGMGKESIIKVRNIRSSGRDVVIFDVYNLLNDSVLNYEFTRTYDTGPVYSGPNGYMSVSPKTFHVGDFDGDSKMEVLVMGGHPSGGSSYYPTTCHIYNLTTNQVLYQTPLLSNYELHYLGDWENDPQSIANATDRLLVIDYDGDGKSDLCHISQAGSLVYTFNNTSGGLTSSLVYTNYGLLKSRLADSDLLLGDFNGDGLTDLFITAPKNSSEDTHSQVFNSTGSGWFHGHNAGSVRKHVDVNYGMLAQDVNSDGLTDITLYSISGFTTRLTYRNHPTGNDYSAPYYNSQPSKLIPAYLSLRNMRSRFLSLKDGVVSYYQFSQNHTQEAMIVGMKNSLGIIEQNEYKTLTDSLDSLPPQAQGNNVIPDFPYIKLKEPIVVLTRSELYKDNSRIDYTKYRYGDAFFHRQGLGFRGLDAFVQINKRGDIYTQTFDPLQMGILKNASSPKGSSTYQYSVNVANDKIVKVLLTSKTETDSISGISSQTSYTYNTHGYPTNTTTTFLTSTENVTTSSTYSSNSNVGVGYNLGYPTSQVSSTSKGANNTYVEGNYSIATEKRQPKISNIRKNGNLVKTVKYSYDSYGAVATESVKHYSSTDSLLTSHEYNTYGQESKTIDPLGLTTLYSYDDVGRLTGVRDIRNNQTTYTYDAFGREASVVRPDSTIKTTTREWVNDVEGALYVVTTQETGKPITQTYYDALGREVRTRQQRFNGTYNKTDRQYDDYGRLFKVSLPYKGSTPLWTTYAYDDYDRTTSVNEPSGRTTTYSYSGLSTTTTEDGIATTRTYDVLGNLAEVEDPAGTITYEMAADGQPISITAPGSIATSFTYDQYRRRTSIIDPSAGTTSYTYDSAGNTASETNANSQVTAYAYDQYNRLVTTTYPEMTVTRVYGSYGDLTNVNSSNGVSRSMTYDNYGRLSSWKETADSVWLQKDYSYSSNNLSSISYTSHKGFLATENYTYANGTLTTISKNGTLPIFQLTQENMLGLPTGVTTLNLTRTYSFSQTGLPTGRTAAGPSATIMNESYSFDAATSNLLSRTDNLRNLTEQFTYDNLNRLTSHDGATVQFDLKGNITGKSNVGTFTYTDTQKPYALTGANAMSGTISTNTQDITFYSFPRPKQIAEGAYSVDFAYDGDLGRVKEEVKQGNSTIEVRYTLGGCYDYIINGQANLNEEDLYLAGGYYDAPMLMQRYGDGSSYLTHLVRDYQGSIVSIVDSTGFWHNDYSYDAWGRPRNPQTHTVYNPSALNTYSSAYRGYCGHEHLPQFGLINMNARLYDPDLSRFLSPDPYVQMPDNTQSFNRYSYCLNNPMKYVDENGEEFLTIFVFAVIAGTFNLGWQYYNGNVNSFWDGVAAFGIGAGAGALGAGIGGYVFTIAGGGAAGAGGFLAGAAGGGAGGAAEALAKELGNHFALGSDFNAWNIVADAGLAAVTGGLVNGAKAVANGKNFIDGSLTNHSIVQKAANYAETSVGGQGHVAGTKKHAHAKELVKRYQDIHGDRDLVLETNVDRNGIIIRPDVVDNKNKMIYDYKFYHHKISPQKFNLSPQMMKYREVLQMPTKVIIPLQPYKKTINFLPSFIIRF